DLDNSTSNVLIPLDSWTNGLLVHELPLSAEYGVSTSIGYGVSSSLSNIAYSLKLINMEYPLPLDTAYRLSGTEAEILKELTKVMVEPILNENTEKAQSESNLSITSNDIKIDLSKEFLVELRKNMYYGTQYEDVVDHIAKILKMVDLIYVPGVHSHKLRMKVFPLSLVDDAKEWWISYRDEKITTWEELVEKFFCKFYPESYDGEDEMLDKREN
ncbi:putative reverse transcriptase domain-containing protein, partial [Tanacetum coccineum]